MIRILHYIGSLGYGGAQTFLMSLYRAVDKEKVQFDFVLYERDDTDFTKEVLKLGGKLFYSPKFKGNNLMEYCVWWNRFWKDNSEYRILHSHIRGSASICLHIAKRNNVVTIIHSHSTSNGNGLKAVIKNIVQFPLRYIADYKFACSYEAACFLYGSKIANAKRYKLISNGIDILRFSFNSEDRKYIRKKYGLEDCFVVGNISRFYKPKNHEFIIHVFSDLVKENPSARLLLVGQGELEDKIKELCRILGLENFVIFAGEQKETEKFYSAMDVFLFPSLWEGLGISLLEAQNSGLPCVITDTIPMSVDLGSNLIYTLSLKDPVKLWSEKINSIPLTNKRERYYEYTQKSKYNMKIVAEELTYFYLEKGNKG